MALTDMDGDGLPDFFRFVGGTVEEGPGTLYYWRNTSEGGNSPLFAGAPTVVAADLFGTLITADSSPSRMTKLDFNGDGRGDFGLYNREDVCWWHTPEHWVCNGSVYSLTQLVSSGGGYELVSLWGGFEAPPHITFVNANDDGCTDVAYGLPHLGTGSITFPGAIQLRGSA